MSTPTAPDDDLDADPVPPGHVDVGFSVDDGHLVVWEERCCDVCYRGPHRYRLDPGAA